MADVKTTALTEATSLDGDDLLYAVVDGASRKITRDNALAGSGPFAGISHNESIYPFPHYYLAGFHDSAWGSTGIATAVAGSDDRFWGWLIWLNAGQEVDALVVNVQTAANASSGATVRLGLFANDGINGTPGTTVIESGDVSIESTGQKIGTATAAALTRTGWYWALGKASMGTATTNPIFRGTTSAGLSLPIPGLQLPGSSLASNSAVPLGRHGVIAGDVVAGSGTFGATFAGTFSPLTPNQSSFPYIAVRVSA